MSGRKKQTLLNGALVLVIASAVVEVIGVLYKIPLTELIGTVGRGYTGTAYNIYIPIYNISMAGLPVAISKLVAQSIAEEHFKDVRKIFKVAFRLFVVMGIIGTVVLALVAYPYAKSIDSMRSLPSIFMIAPAVFVCCVMATYRGYYSGLCNQTPSAVSQMFEVVGKLAFGLALAYVVQRYGFRCFEAGNPVYGIICNTREEAIIALTPFAAAASIFGVTMGAACSLIYLILRHKITGDQITREELKMSPPAQSGKKIAKMLIAIAVPIVVSTLVMNITNLIDSWSIQFRLQAAIDRDLPMIQKIYSEALSSAGKMSNSVLKSYLYGAYEIALDFRNLIPSITTALGLSAIPILSEAWTLKNHRAIKTSVESVLRVTMLISLPAGIGMAILARQILTIVYGDFNSITVAAPVMAMYGCFTFIMCVAQPVINMLQALGRADIPMKSVSVSAVVKVVVNFILVGIPAINIKGAVIGTFCFYFINLCVNIIWLIKITGVKINIKSVFIKPLFCTFLCAVGAWSFNGLANTFLPQFSVNSRINTYTVSGLIGILVALIVYFLALLFTQTIVAEDVKMLPKGEKICKVLAKFGFIG